MVLHITHRDAWETAKITGYYKPQSLESDGFIHCSTIEQTVDTANQFFPNQRNLVLLCIDESKLESPLKFEAPVCAGDQRTDSLFPHIYGALNASAVVRVVDFSPDANGVFAMPEKIGRF